MSSDKLNFSKQKKDIYLPLCAVHENFLIDRKKNSSLPFFYMRINNEDIIWYPTGEIIWQNDKECMLYFNLRDKEISGKSVKEPKETITPNYRARSDDID